LNEKADRAQLVGVSGWKDYDGPARPAQAFISGPSGPADWPFSEVIHANREIVIDNLAARFGPLPVGSWNAQPEQGISCLFHVQPKPNRTGSSLLASAHTGRSTNDISVSSRPPRIK